MWNNPQTNPALRRDCNSSIATGARLQSAFMRLAHYCKREIPEASDLSLLVTPHWAKESIFHLSLAVSRNLRQAIGITEHDWEAALGTDLLTPVPPKTLLVSSLRYCSVCIEQGWHAAVFQHVGVLLCPAHGERLKTGCPHCGRSINTSCLAIVENHNYCPNCGRTIGAFDTANLEDSMPPRGFADLHDALSAIQNGETVASYFSSGNADQLLNVQAHVVGVAMHRLWPKRPLLFVRNFQSKRSTNPRLSTAI